MGFGDFPDVGFQDMLAQRDGTMMANSMRFVVRGSVGGNIDHLDGSKP